jgi:hypothetical protein
MAGLEKETSFCVSKAPKLNAVVVVQNLGAEAGGDETKKET